MVWKFLVTLACATGFAQPLFFFNGKIVSSYSNGANVSSELLVENGKVVRLGNKLSLPKDVLKKDLRGKWVFPALTDAHAHLLSTGREKKQLNLRGLSLPAIQQSILNALSKKPEMIVGFGWDQNLWPGKSFPQIDFLDSLTQTVPVVLFRIDGHAAWANTLALKRAGLMDLQNPKGIPKGVVVDVGLEKLESIIPPSTDLELREEIKSVVNYGLSRGFTSLHDAGISSREFAVLKDTILRDQIPFRFYEMASASDRKLLESVLKAGPQVNLLDSRLHLRAVKIYLDGALGSRGALFEAPYEDQPHQKGIQIRTEKELEELIRLSDQSGFQVAVHAIGTKANEIAVSVFEKVWGVNTASKRPRIEHAQVLSESLIRKMGQLGIVASMQPVHCSSDSPWVIERIGKKRARFSYPWRSLLQAKVPLAFGTDSPIEDFTPWPGLFAAVTRLPLNSIDHEAFFPEERISTHEALRAFSEGAAFSAFQEDFLGTLAPGKWADFLVVGRNLLELKPGEILKFEVESTYFSGREVYRKK